MPKQKKSLVNGAFEKSYAAKLQNKDERPTVALGRTNWKRQEEIRFDVKRNLKTTATLGSSTKPLAFKNTEESSYVSNPGSGFATFHKAEQSKKFIDGAKTNSTYKRDRTNHEYSKYFDKMEKHLSNGGSFNTAAESMTKDFGYKGHPRTLIVKFNKNKKEQMKASKQ